MIRTVFQITCDKNEAAALSRDIAIEQTVEFPESMIQSEEILQNIVGHVEHIEEDAQHPNRFTVVIDYQADISGYQIPQFLNLIYGNISLKRNLRLVDIEFSDEFLNHFKGPRFGISGIRNLLGIYNRPLLSTALKPRGSSAEELAAITKAFALGKGDIIKDDHNLIDESFEAFQHRVSLCQKAVMDASNETGRRTLYFPNIMAPVEQIEPQIQYVLSLGIKGILISPFVVGMDHTRYLAEKYPLVFMAHPTFTGTFFHDSTHGIEHGLFLGKLFRMLGMDVSIFPNYGGRFVFSQEDCHSICRHLRSPLGKMEPVFPAPAGGMKYENIPSMAEEYGPDTIFLIGGALLTYSSNLAESTEAFLNKIKEFYEEKFTSPAVQDLSACEVQNSSCDASCRQSKSDILDHLIFKDDFTWEGRTPSDYKSSEDLPFKNITRHELIGPFGEQTAFDLRYFEIAPGGYSSLEKHQHTHTIIAVRGEGLLDKNGTQISLKPNDIAYVQPMEVHQLRNDSDTPFGFYCIVDHQRDKPMKP